MFKMVYLSNYKNKKLQGLYDKRHKYESNYLKWQHFSFLIDLDCRLLPFLLIIPNLVFLKDDGEKTFFNSNCLQIGRNLVILTK